MKIRPALLADLLQIVQLRLRNAEYHLTLNKELRLRKDIREQLTKHSRFLIEDIDSTVLLIEAQDQISGYMLGNLKAKHPIFDYPIEGFIGDIFIEEKLQGRGLGKRLVEEMIIWFRAKNVEQISLGVHLANQQAFNFWKKMGFEQEVAFMHLII